MLYHLLYPLKSVFGGFNVFRHITFRTIFAILTALIISMMVGAWFIRKLREMQIGQYIREDGPQSHFSKNGTPTMGGLMIIFATLSATVLWAELTNPYIWLLVLVTLGFGLIGFFDDYLKVIKKHNKGLSGRAKLVTQTLVALVPPIWFYANPGFDTTLTIPFFKAVQPDLGFFFIPFAVFVIVQTHTNRSKTKPADESLPSLITRLGVIRLTWMNQHAKS